MVLLGIVVAGLGILVLVARDFFWALTEMSNSFAGRTSERTELWEAGQMLSGVVTILLGVVVICVGMNEDRQREERRLAPTQTAVAQEAQSGVLDAMFADWLPRWHDDATDAVKHVNPREINVNTGDIYYGRCADGAFFVAVRSVNGRYYDDYVYLREGDPLDCRANGLRFYGGGSDHVDWRRVTLIVDRPTAIPRYVAPAVALVTPVVTSEATVEVTAAPIRTPRLE